MAHSLSLSKWLRRLAVSSLLLAFWPGLVVTGTPVDHMMKKTFQAAVDVAEGRVPAVPEEASGTFNETQHWQLRVGLPLRPFLAVDVQDSAYGDLRGKLKVTVTEERSSSAYADPVGILYSVILAAFAWLLWRLSRILPSREQPALG